MLAYIIRRTLYVIPVVFGVALVTFFLFHVVGWDPASQMLGRHASKDEITALRTELGLDLPKWVNFAAASRQGWTHLFDSQWFFYCKQIVTLDFGRSFASQQKISTLMLNGIVPSLVLAVPIFFIELVVAIALALFAAYYRNTWIDRSLVLVAVMGMSVSSLVYIMVAQYWLAGEWRLFPVWGFEGPQYLALPLLIGVVAGVGGSVRFYRTVVLDEMFQDYVRTARAKGVSPLRILFSHVLRNALIPILTNVIIALPFLYTGSLLLESFFGIPGLGRQLVMAIPNGDEDVIYAETFLGTMLFVVANTLTDIAYTWADPRIRLK